MPAGKKYSPDKVVRKKTQPKLIFLRNLIIKLIKNIKNTKSLVYTGLFETKCSTCELDQYVFEIYNLFSEIVLEFKKRFWK